MKADTSKTTILVISMGFLVLHLLFKWEWPMYVSLALGLTGILSDGLSARIAWAWMNLSLILSKIVPSLLLGLFFYLILFPISLFSRLFNKDPLMLSKKHKSYYVDVNKEYSKKSFEHIW